MDNAMLETNGKRMRQTVRDLALSGGRLAGNLLGLVVPVTCCVCRVPVAGTGGLCANCWSELEMVSWPMCDVYGTPFAFDEGVGAISARAIAKPPAWDRARAVATFNDRAQHLVHALKYRDRHEVMRPMATMMTHAGRDLLAQADLTVPVPLHRWRLWARRYNQAALLCAEISRLSGVEYQPEILVRNRNTRSQVGLGESERGRNVKGAFSVPDACVPKILGRRVLVVDDVLTSGATASECARVLTLAGAAHVDVLVFALVSHAG